MSPRDIADTRMPSVSSASRSGSTAAARAGSLAGLLSRYEGVRVSDNFHSSSSASARSVLPASMPSASASVASGLIT